MYLEKYHCLKVNETLETLLIGSVLFLASLLLYTSALKYNFENYNQFALIGYVLVILSIIHRVKWVTENKKRFARFFITIICITTIAISLAILSTLLMWKYNLL